MNFNDLVTLEQFYNSPTRDWADGNSTGNGSFADLVALEQNYGHSIAGFSVAPGGSGNLSPSTSGGGSSPVPEPASLAVLVLGGGALLARRRRR